MGRLRTDAIDRELGQWLREESATRAPSGLVEDVFARTSRTRQARRVALPSVLVWPRRGRPRLVGADGGPSLWRGPMFAGAIALAVVVIALTLALPPSPPGPGGTTAPTPRPSASVSASASALPPGSASASPADTSSPTPEATTLGALTARRLPLGPDAAPISVIQAFGSIWVANIHAGDVRRIDPTTMRELARIPIAGAAWFAVAGGGLWVTHQTGTGVSRIDPATNTVVAHLGDVPPCAAPVVAFQSLWQSACDGDVYLRIDPAANKITDTIPAQGHIFLTLAGGRLMTLGPDGLARLDPTKRTFTAIANPDVVGASFLTSDAGSLWVQTDAGYVRIDPTNGRSIRDVPAAGSQGIFLAGDHAWLALTGIGVEEIDLATYRVLRTIPIYAPFIPYEAGGVLWVTDFDHSDLWRIDL